MGGLFCFLSVLGCRKAHNPLENGIPSNSIMQAYFLALHTTDSNPALTDVILKRHPDLHSESALGPEQPLSAGQAMQLAFGNYDTDKQTSQWPRQSFPRDTLRRWKQATGFNTSSRAFYSKFLVLLPFQRQDTNFTYLVTSVRDRKNDRRDSYSCGTFGVWLFQQKAGRWEVIFSHPIVDCLGSGSLTPPKPKLISAGPNTYVLSFHTTIRWGGITNSHALWYAKIGAGMRSIGQFEVSFSNKGLYGSDQGVSWKGALELTRSKSGAWYDVAVYRKGKLPGKDWTTGQETLSPAIPLDDVIRYRFDGEQYVKQAR